LQYKVAKTRIVSELNIGMMGPIAFGKQMQTGIHKAIGGSIPGGWKNQIGNDIVVNYRLGFEKEFLRVKNIFLVNGNADLNVGTLFTNTSIGFNAILGLLKNTATPNRVSIYAYAQPKVNLIAYDASLQGGLLNNNNSYTIPAEDIERAVYHFNWGFVMKFKKLYLEYSRTILTKEFSTGELSGWGGIRVGFRLKLNGIINPNKTFSN